jgi:hypothetical protein
MILPLFLYGLAIWTGATALLRIAGQHLLHQDLLRTILLFAISFVAMALLVRRLCSRFQSRKEEWPIGAVSLVMPTLLLDPFSSAFFPIVFPNMAPELAGVFGGWMLCCCAGALAGVTFGQRKTA